MVDSRLNSPSATPTAGQVMEKLFQTTHRLHLQFETFLAEYDLPDYVTGPRLRFLVTVQEAGRVRMGDMAARCGIAPRTVTQFVDALEQANMIVRHPDPDDRRATLLALTDEALPVMAKARAAMKESAEKVLGLLPADKLNQLYDILLSLTTDSEGH
ncbi:MarR family transcriptional regulator [Paenibacillus sp. 5J-6]|uniref:MarR family transcriptional regulator n=1 Tax=Paenibacillus silvestris TaxID=2606219 RepID=A0A6L8V9V0_9BACL|nr:MarR family transcriptional regulator [Paenibacillus silvestris]MZQ86462.1 MarR family transcriptional regulator [Paenibacillus silvestris]